MVEKIGVETTELEDIVGRAAHIADIAQEIVAKITTVTGTLPNLSSQGSFHELVVSNKTNVGLGNFDRKAKEFQTLSEVFSRHIQNTLEGMIDVDRAMAVYVANKLLNSSKVSEEDKQYMREQPEDSINYLAGKAKESREAVADKKIYGPPKPDNNGLTSAGNTNLNLGINNSYATVDSNGNVQFSNTFGTNPIGQNHFSTPATGNSFSQNSKGGK